MEKLLRVLIVGLFSAVVTLVGFGWKAYGTMDDMGKEIKKEVKAEMLEIRNRDMEYVRDRFDTVEKLMVGRVVFQGTLPDPDKK